jgi:hypothetical protein
METNTIVCFNERHGFRHEFQALLSEYCLLICVAASQLIKPSLFTSLWGGPVSVDLFLGRIKGHKSSFPSANNSPHILKSVIKVTLISMYYLFYGYGHGLINYKDTIAKCPKLKIDL